MPGENVSFVAFGQFHTDEKALQAVLSRLQVLHQSMGETGRKLVIGIEHAQENVRAKEDIKELHNEGLVQTYCDRARSLGKTPTYDEFCELHRTELQWGSRTMPLEKKEDLPHQEQRFFLKKREGSLKLFFENRLNQSKEDVNMGKGPSRVAEAELLMWALNAKVEVRGLDPVSDRGKQERLVGPDGRINGHPLEDMEYERIQGMGKNGATLMQGLSENGGGCVAAVNIGAAHLGSLEVAIRDALQGDPELKNAPVQMCMLLPKENLAPGQLHRVSAQLMDVSVQDMRGAHKRMAERVGDCEKELRSCEVAILGRKDMIDRVDKLPVKGELLATLVRQNPSKVANMLNYGESDQRIRLKEADVQAVRQGLDDGRYKTPEEGLKAKLGELVTAEMVSLERSKEALEDSMEKLKASTEEVLPFAERVEARVKNQPDFVFKAGSCGSDGHYDPAILDRVGRPQTVADKLRSQEHNIQRKSGHGMDEAREKVSTRSQLKPTNTTIKQVNGVSHKM